MVPSRTQADYTVGWICALPVELTAAQILLDEEHEDLPQAKGDTNVYTYGRIGSHNVVIAALAKGEPGIGPAARVAARMLTSFDSIRVGLMVGIGGGVPSIENDIRLGDVVVSAPKGAYGGVIQYDFGKLRNDGLQRASIMSAPPEFLRNAITKLEANHGRRKSQMSSCITMLQKNSDSTFERGLDDQLFESNYEHIGLRDCCECDVKKTISRPPRSTHSHKIHYGTIASGNQVMMSAIERDRISQEFDNVLCFEMEAAGLMNNFPCLVIRGISDYADSHKGDDWQGYAAGVAAAYAKDLLLIIPRESISQARTADQTMREDPAITTSLRLTDGRGKDNPATFRPQQSVRGPTEHSTRH